MSPTGTLAVDVGGTFTDITFADAATGTTWVAKTPSTPSDLSAGFVTAIRKVLALAGRGAPDVLRVFHGTTTATNAILEGKTPPTALVTTAGFKYVLEIGRHDIPRHGNLYGWSKPTRPITPDRVFEVTERLDVNGAVLAPLDEDEARAVARQLAQLGVPAVAVVFLHAYANPAHEQRMHAILREECPGMLVSLSSEVLPQFREFERTMATALNAAVMPPVSRYVSVLRDAFDAEGLRAPLLIMKSDGGVTSAATCVRQPVQTVLSGPAAGVIGAVSVARSAGHRDIISIDVGGTSADICLVRGGRPEITKDGMVGPFPLKLPILDIHTIGAGGGSIAAVSGAGRLTVGPRSAGAEPGPVCYGRGGMAPTVTDAHLVLGRIPPALLGGEIPLDVGGARAAIGERIGRPLGLGVEEAAAGIVEIIDNSMARAIRTVSVGRGHDPRRFALVAFGGAGPLHACRLAELLDIPTVVIPARPGVLSTWGLLDTDIRTTFARTVGTAERRPAAGGHAVPVLDAAYWFNDPYISDGAVQHHQDMVFVVPVFHEGRIVAFTATFGHYQDIGGLRAGSISPHATEIYHEGVLVPPVRIMREGQLNEEAYRIFLRNSRLPDLVEGDTRAMMASCRLAEMRLAELFTRYGAATVLAAFDECIAQTGARTRELFLGLVPEGEWTFHDFLDSDGGADARPFRIELTLGRQGDRVRLDGSRSDDQARGPINYMTNPGLLWIAFGRYLQSLHDVAQVDEERLRDQRRGEPLAAAIEILALHREITPVDDQLGPGDVGGLVRRQEQHGVRHLVHLAHSLHRHARQHLRAPRGIGRGLGGAHRGQDAGVHRVHADAVPGVLHGGRLRHDAHGRLRGVVAHVDEVLAHEARDRRDVDDGTPAGLLHGGNAVLHPQEDSLGVDVHQRVPGRRAHGVRIVGAADPGVVDQDVQLVEGVHRGPDGRAPVRLAGHVQAHEARLPARLADGGRHLTPFRLQHVGNDDLRPLPGEHPGLGLPHATGAAGDQRDLSLEPHVPSLPVRPATERYGFRSTRSSFSTLPA